MKHIIIIVISGIILSGIVGIKAIQLIESNQVIYKDNQTVDVALNNLFDELKEGKELLADAISSQGIETTSNNTLVEMARNIESINNIGTYYESNDYVEKTIPSGKWIDLCSITIPAGVYVGNVYVSFYLPYSSTTFTATAIMRNASAYVADFKDVTWPAANSTLSFIYESTEETKLFASVYHTASDNQQSMACNIRMIKIK